MVKQKKLKKDLIKISNFYEKILDNLYKKLNLIHKKNFSKRYWEILIWVWLYRFIIYYFDRWEIVKSLKKKYKNKKLICKKIGFQEIDFIPRDTEDWCTTNVMSDDWNHWVICKIIKENDFIEIFSVNKIKIKPKSYFNYQNLFTKENIIKRTIKSIFKNKNKDIFSQNTGFSKSSPNQIKYFFQNFSSINKDIFWKFDKKINLQDRDFISQTNKNYNSKFEKFLMKEIKYNFPTIFLENYKKGINEIKINKLPKNPKLIITSMDDISNEPFKFYTAEKILKGSKLFLIQHGGSYGTSENFPIEKIQTKIADKYFSWGWKNSNKKIIPNFCQKTLGLSIKQNKNTKGLLIPILDLSLFPGNIADGRPRSIHEINDYIGILKSFFSNLKKNIQDDSAFKYLDVYKVYPNYVLRSLKSNFKDATFFSSNKSGCLFLNKYKLNIETFNSTGYLESLNLNLPTILIFDKNYCQLRKKTLKYFRLLEKVHILFYDPKKAAKFVNKNYKNLDKWWNSRKVQNTVKMFVNQFAKPSNDPYGFLKILEKQK